MGMLQLRVFYFFSLDLQKFISARQRLEAQLNENKVVEEVIIKNIYFYPIVEIPRGCV